MYEPYALSFGPEVQRPTSMTYLLLASLVVTPLLYGAFNEMLANGSFKVVLYVIQLFAVLI